MRRAMLTGSLFALLAALFAMWAFRYERAPGLPVWSLADLRNELPAVPGVAWTGRPDFPGIGLRVNPGGKPLAIRLSIPGIREVDGLHLRFRMNSRGLSPGCERWQDGRFMVEWHQPQGGGALEENPVGSVRHDTRGELQDLVVQPLHGPAVPALRLEHLGRSGEFDLSELEITVVRERALWKTGRWFLALGWLAWVAAVARSWPGISRWRALCSATLWVLMGMHFVIPGPWKIQRAMVPAFQLGVAPAAEARVRAAGVPGVFPAVSSGSIEALGKLPDQGSLVLRVKLGIARARPLLHMLLLFAPALAFAFLLGRKPAVFLAAALAVAIELAQVAFGYGFDLIDVGDLASDAVGIALAMWVWKRVVAKTQRRQSGLAEIW